MTPTLSCDKNGAHMEAKSYRTILIVDDDHDVATSLARRLRLKGYNVITAFSGEDAVAFLQKADVDVVVTDLRMPESSIDGPALCRWIQTSAKNAPKMVLMSSFNEALKSLPDPAPSVMTLPKPFLVQELLHLIA